MAEVVLMNKDKEVLKAERDEESMKFRHLLETTEMEAAPFSVRHAMEQGEEAILSKLNDWFGMRAIPDYRDSSREVLDILGVGSREKLAGKHYALSLTDQYWLKPVGSRVSWRDINYFENEYDSREFFDATYGFGTFGSLSLHGVRSDKFHTPNNTLGGQLKKTWVQIDGTNYLFKGASSLHNIEPVNEVLASKICEILDVPKVDYELRKVHSKRQEALVSVCRCMINENQEFIPAYELMSVAGELSHTPTDYYLYLDLLLKHGIPRAEEYLQKMFMLDYIMLNEDRHLGNFGIIRNVETLEWESICPIFDTGRSCNTNVSESYWDFEKGEVKCFTSGFVSSEILPSFFSVNLSEKQLEELRAVPKAYLSMLKEYQISLKLFDEQIEKLKLGMDQRIERFNEMMMSKGLVRHQQAELEEAEDDLEMML